MTTTFPPKPWKEGDTFTNETTGVGYTYNGNQWLASGGPKVEGEYLPLVGGDLSGKLNINVSSGEALTINSNKVKFWSSGAVALGNYTNFKDNELVTKGYTDGAIKDAVENIEFPEPEPAPLPEIPSPFRKFKYAGDRTWGNMRPGEFQMLDKDQNITSELDNCKAIIFKGEDADGNRAVRDENRVSYRSWGGSALNILNSGQTRLYFRAPIGMLEYGVDIDCYSLWWQELDAGAVRTSTFTRFTNSQIVYLQCADLFF